MNMKSFLFITLAIPAMLLLAGCGHKMRIWNGMLKPKALMLISVGMEKQEVLTQIGEPDILRGSITNKFGQVVELWEYTVERWVFGSPRDGQTYWLYFYNNKLAQWGMAGDWKEAANNIQEIRFR